MRIPSPGAGTIGPLPRTEETPLYGRHRRAHRFRWRPWFLAASVVLAAAGGGFLFREDLSALLTAERPAGPPVVVPSPGPPGSPGPSPEPSPTPQPKGRLVIHGTGDVNLDPSYIPALAQNGFAHAWSGLGGLFRDDDLTVINLENVISTRGVPVDKQFTFRGPPEALPAMRKAGIEVANLGNNHTFDYGPEALVDTREHLEDAGIAAVGAGRNARQALKPAFFDLDGWRVAVLGFGRVVEPFPQAVATAESPGVAGGHDDDLMVRTVRQTARKADLVVVSIHWGVELDAGPRPDQVELGHRFVDAGADVIFGHHSHRLQPLEHHREAPIFWGLGNFVWPNFSVEGSTTAVARVTVRPNGRLQGELLPAFIQTAGRPVLIE